MGISILYYVLEGDIDIGGVQKSRISPAQPRTSGPKTSYTYSAELILQELQDPA